MPKAHNSTTAAKLALWAQARRNYGHHQHAAGLEEAAQHIRRIMVSAPAGPDFDTRISIDLERSGNRKLTFHLTWAHTNSNGNLTGHTSHTVIVRPGLQYPEIQVSGTSEQYRDRIHDAVYNWLF